jgi:hypothetical protein
MKCSEALQLDRFPLYQMTASRRKLLYLPAITGNSRRLRGRFLVEESNGHLGGNQA